MLRYTHGMTEQPEKKKQRAKNPADSEKHAEQEDAIAEASDEKDPRPELARDRKPKEKDADVVEE